MIRQLVQRKVLVPC